MADKNFDIDQFIAQAKAAREQSLAKQAEAEAAAKAKKADQATITNVQRAANNKFQYAQNLNTTLVDIEGQLRAYGMKIARGDKLDPIQQKDFDRLAKQYKSVNTDYTKAMNEGNSILAKMPDTGIKEKKAVQDQAGIKEETPSTPTDISITDFKNLLADPNNSEMLRGYQESLQKMGWKGKADGKYSLSFQSEIEKLYQKRTALPEALRGKTFQEFIGIAATDPSLIGGSISGTGAGNVPYTTISNKTQAAALINNAFQGILNRDATAAEIASLTTKLNAAEKKNKTQTVGGVTTGGLNREQFLTDIIKSRPEYAKRKEDAKALTTESLLATAKANGLTPNQLQLDTWNQRIQNGEDINVIKKAIRDTASIGLPDNIKKLMADGTDLATIYDPYKNVMYQTLELNPDSINLNDPTLRSAITAQGEMPIYDFQRALRKDARWQYTNNAREEVSNSVTKVLKDFGFMG